MREEKRNLTAKEIADSFSVGYYEIQIEEYEERISNILCGNGDKLGNYVYRADSSFKSEREKHDKVAQLRKSIEDKKKIIKEIHLAISSIEHGIYVLEEEAKKSALIGALSDNLRECFSKHIDGPNGTKKVTTDTYDAIFKNRFFEGAKSKYRRLWSKEYNSISKSKRKISKDMYKKLKKLNNKTVVVEREYGYHYSRYSSNDKYDYTSLSSALKDNNKSLKGFANSLYSDIRNKYNAYNMDSLSILGVEVDKVERAKEYADGTRELSFNEFDPILEAMDYLSKHYSVYKRFKTFSILRDSIEQANQLTIDVECLDLIIDAYDNTVIADTELFAHLKEIYRKQNKKLTEVSRRAKEMYEKTGLKEFIEAEKRLRELFNNCGRWNYQLAENEDKLGYSHPETEELRELYRGARSEMLSILLKYPELNRPEYFIDLSMYDKKGRYKGKNPEENIMVDRPVTRTSSYGDEPIPAHIVERDLGEPNLDNETVIVEPSSASLGRNNSGISSIEMPDELTAFSTYHYNNYMREKVLKTELGMLTFSEYLERVAPHLTDLIEIEKYREEQAATVFKLYVLYLASIDNKRNAMKFSEFAKHRYGLEQKDLPFEYSDEEIVKKL